MVKEFFYLGYYYDVNGKFILKVGTTNNLKRRASEHTRNYRKSENYTMPQNSEFTYLWHLPLSKYNTLRLEDKTKDEWKKKNFGSFVKNDRFVFDNPPSEVQIKMRKNYTINIV